MVWLCVRIMPTPAETSQDSVPTWAVDCAGVGEPAIAVIVSAAAAEATFRKATIRMVISRTPKNQRDLRRRETNHSDASRNFYRRRASTEERTGPLRAKPRRRNVLLEPELGGGAPAAMQAR